MSTDDKASPVEGVVRAPTPDDWLGPCPFCGSDAIGQESLGTNDAGAMWCRAVCQDCKARGPAGLCSGGKRWSRREWADKWNQRNKTVLSDALKEIYAIRGEDAQISAIVHKALNAL